MFAGRTLQETLDSFAEPRVRAELEALYAERTLAVKGGAWDNLPVLVGWDNIRIADLAGQRELIGRSMEECARERGVSPTQFMLDVLREEGGNVRMTDTYMREELVESIFLHAGAMIGTDTLLGGLKHPRVYGTFPRIISRFVFDRGLCSLEEAVSRMTSIPAARLGIVDRGVIRAGAAADLVLFGDDFHLPSSATAHTGLRWLFVNGEVKVREGVYQMERAGRLLLRQTPPSRN